jgi:2-polyprenyl-3-methyl-5-hydroxy-6-metoxy-1,4-benzoquinol methylase
LRFPAGAAKVFRIEFAGNLVNTGDFAALWRQVRRSPRRLGARLVPGRRRRVRQAWSRVEAAPTHWWDIPPALQRRQRLATGDPGLSVPAYVTSGFLGTGLRGLSLGCGNGDKEAAWANTGAFTSLECYDLSAERVAAARKRHATHPVLSFEVADAYDLAFDSGAFDVIVFEDALHHLAPIPLILERCKRWLKPGGHLVVHEYVGPRKFQHSDRLLEAAAGVLAVLPERLRMSYAHGTVKRRVQRPSLLRMRLTDPSEAVESDLIRPTVRSLFDVLEERDLGVTLVSVVLDDIAQNFTQADRGWLELIFDVEDALLEAGELESIYALMVATA